MATWRILNRQRGRFPEDRQGKNSLPLPRGVKMEVRVEDTRFKLSFVIMIRMLMETSRRNYYI